MVVGACLGGGLVNAWERGDGSLFPGVMNCYDAFCVDRRGFATWGGTVGLCVPGRVSASVPVPAIVPPLFLVLFMFMFSVHGYIHSLFPTTLIPTQHAFLTQLSPHLHPKFLRSSTHRANPENGACGPGADAR
jgi:hypothetical protein